MVFKWFEILETEPVHIKKQQCYTIYIFSPFLVSSFVFISYRQRKCFSFAFFVQRVWDTVCDTNTLNCNLHGVVACQLSWPNHEAMTHHWIPPPSPPQKHYLFMCQIFHSCHQRHAIVWWVYDNIARPPPPSLSCSNFTECVIRTVCSWTYGHCGCCICKTNCNIFFRKQCLGYKASMKLALICTVKAGSMHQFCIPRHVDKLFDTFTKIILSNLTHVRSEGSISLLPLVWL